MKKMIVWCAAGVLVLAATGCVDRAAQQQTKETEKVVTDTTKAVSVKAASTTTVTDTVEVNGDITAAEDTTIGSKQNNKVMAVYVKDGDQVTGGQLLATLDDSGALAQLSQAQAQVSTAIAAELSARAAVAQAKRNLAVGPRKSTSGVMLAQAQVNGAKRALDKQVNGFRPEEKRQAQANLDSAKANLVLQEKQLERTKKLVEQGAIAGQNLDTQQAAYDQALAQEKSAQQALDIDMIGNRQEDIDSARAAYQEAIQNLRTAQDQKRLDPLLQDQVDAANAQMDSARAQLSSARAQINIAKQAVSDTKVFAPFAGTISGRPIQAGTIAGQGTAIVRIVGGAGIYFNGQIPSTNIDKVHSGDPVSVRVDGIPGKAYSGTIVGLNPLADSVGRLFSVRVHFNTTSPELRAGMFAHGSVVIRSVPNAIVVPSNAVVTKGDAQYVFTVVNNKAKQVKVTTGLGKDDVIQVIGLPAGAQVVVDGQNDLTDGAAVKVNATAAVMNGKAAPASEAKG